MADYQVRVELHGGQSDDYMTLHERMDAYGYVTFIKADDGRDYLLPTAEYDLSNSSLGILQVRDEVLRIADSVRPGAWVLVTLTSGRAWSLRQL